MKPLFTPVLATVWLCLFTAVICKAQLPDLRADAGKLKIAQTMEKQALAVNDSLLLGKAYYLFGEAYNMGGNNATSKNYFLKARRTLKPLGDFYELGMTYLRLIEGLHLTATSRKDIDYAREAIAVFKRIHSPGGLARGYNYLTSTYKRKWIWSGADINAFKANKAQFDTLVHCIDTTEHYARLANDTTMLAEANQQRGDMYRCLHDKRAIVCFAEAQRLFSAVGNDTLVVHVFCQLVDTHLTLSAYDKAGQALKQAQTLTQKTGINEYWMTTHLYETARNYYRQTGQWQQAYTCQVMLSDLYTYRLQGNRDQLVAALNIEHEAEKKESQIKAQTRELANLHLQQRFSVVTSALLLLTAGLSIIFFRLYRKNRRTSRQNQELVKEQNHRVKNNLQVVSSMLSLQADQLTDEAAKQAVEESQLRVQAIGILHRRLYDGEQLAKVKMNDLCRELVRGVFQVFDWAQVPVRFDIDPIYLSADKATPVALILNELTTNACKYAFPVNTHPMFWISCHQKGRTIQLTVTDNGPGLGNSDLSGLLLDDLRTNRQQSFGLMLMRAQVSQLNGTAHFGPATETDPPGTTFSLHFKP